MSRLQQMRQVFREMYKTAAGPLQSAINLPGQAMPFMRLIGQSNTSPSQIPTLLQSMIQGTRGAGTPSPQDSLYNATQLLEQRRNSMNAPNLSAGSQALGQALSGTVQPLVNFAQNAGQTATTMLNPSTMGVTPTMLSGLRASLRPFTAQSTGMPTNQSMVKQPRPK